jgi:hypothetical protein
MTLSERIAARKPKPGRCLLHGYVTERCCNGYDLEAARDTKRPEWLRRGTAKDLTGTAA